MKKISAYLILMAISLFISACGSDGQLSGNSKTSSTSNLNNSCSCNSTYMPVCDTLKNVSYENSCLANCYGATKTIQGNCACSNMPVCGNDGQTYTECAAVANIRLGILGSIVKFADCSSTPL